MPTTDELRHYHVFVLRAWEERGSPIGPARWRFSLEAPSTGQRRGFATLEALIAFLTNQFGPQGVESGQQVDDQGKEGQSLKQAILEVDDIRVVKE